MRIKSFGQSTFAAFCAGAVRSAVVRHETGAQPGSHRTPDTVYYQSISYSPCNLAARVSVAHADAAFTSSCIRIFSATTPLIISTAAAAAATAAAARALLGIKQRT